jgi:hypothetical protein
MSKAPVSDFIRAAVLEKAERDLSRLDQQLTALDTLQGARAQLDTLLDRLAKGTAPVVSISHETSAITRFKKLRRAVEEAHVLAGELSIQLEVDEALARTTSARAKIVAELETVGVTPPEVAQSPSLDSSLAAAAQ